MLTFHGSGPRLCNGLSRRSFLQVGAFGIGGLTLADVLRADATQPFNPRRSFINIYLPGGPSHIDTFDPKPDAPKEIRGSFAAIPTAISGVQFCEHLPQLAGMMGQLAVIRSLTGINDEHHFSQTESGWQERNLSSVGGRPSFGSVVARVQGTSNGTSPTFVDLSGQTRPGFLSSVYAPFRPDNDGRANLTLNGQLTANRLGDRNRLLGDLDRIRREADSSGAMKALDAFTSRAIDVVTSGQMAKAFDLDREDPRIRDRYRQGTRPGNGYYEQNDRFLLARRLIEAGVRCVSLAWGGWDTHGDNFNILARQLPPLDQGLSTLIQDLDQRGLLQDTVIAVWGEFGRTPRVNGGAGRDHWARAASVLLTGGGFRVGQVIGATNRLGEEAKDRPVHLQEVFASLYQHMGIDPKYTTLQDNNGRPQYLVEHPQPVRELFA